MELLTVIAIIGILAAILIPTVGNVMKNARKTQASSNSRQIALAYNTYALEGARVRNIGVGTWTTNTPTLADNARGWAAVLATFAGLNDASFYFISDDPLYPSGSITTVLDGTTGDLSPTTNFPSNGIAWALVINAPRGAPTSTTPLLWTRGWSAAGDPQPANGWGIDSPWGNDGGHIAYLDGHVTWQRTTNAENPTNGDLVSYVSTNRGAATSNVYEAAGIGSAPAAASGSNPGVVNALNSDAEGS